MGNKIIVSIHQPNFIPWIGYFYKIVRSDIFVLLDNVQYTKNGFINRNRIKVGKGTMWLTIPVKTKGRFGQLIKEVEINNAVDWRNNHLKTLEMNYKKAKFFKPIFNGLKNIYYTADISNLCEFNIKIFEWLLSQLKLDKKVIRASELDVKGKSTQLLIDIVKKVSGNVYLSGFGGGNYQEENLFKNNGIELIYYDFKHPVYYQLWSNFIYNLSIIDLLFNYGPDSLDIILYGRRN